MAMDEETRSRFNKINLSNCLSISRKHNWLFFWPSKGEDTQKTTTHNTKGNAKRPKKKCRGELGGVRNSY